MRRLPQIPRRDWPRKLEEIGFHFHSIDEAGVSKPGASAVYWREDVAYVLSATEVEALYAATGELHRLCLEAVEHVVRRNRFAELAIGEPMAALARESWARREPSLFGRFDLAFDGAGPPKMLEYNADTPTSLPEAALAQWQWKEDVHPGADQFNSLHEALLDRFRALRVHYSDVPFLHFACFFEAQEDVGNAEYLMDLALQAGFDAKILDLGDIGLSEGGRFYDKESERIELCFKLYPWEQMATDTFAFALPSAGTRWIEPPWKMILSNKGILPILWELFPRHPNLLPASRDARQVSGVHVRKPLLSREGANVEVVEEGAVRVRTSGSYGAEGYVYQGYAPLFRDGDRHAVIGSWIVGDEACGIGIREDSSIITQNTSAFVPHYFEPSGAP